MKKFEVTIEQTLSTTVVVEATSEETAHNLVREMYRNSEIIDFINAEISVNGESNDKVSYGGRENIID